MTLSGNGTDEEPLGDVTATKNVELVLNTQECLAATTDDQNGYWVITHSAQGNGGFYAFHIDGTTGVLNTTPVISGRNHTISGISLMISTIKFNSFSNELAHVTMDAYSADIWEFDNSIGSVIGTPTTVSPGNTRVYGGEFSADTRYFYLSDHLNGDIYRYDLTSADVQASEVNVGSVNNFSTGALQMGPDGVIYIAYGGGSFSTESYLGAIYNSNSTDPN